MPEGQVDTTPGSAAVATPPSAEPTTQSSGTVETGTSEANGAAQGASGTEESFTQLDPNTLPPQLKAAYNNMLTDYKKKTQELALKRKDYDSLNQKASLYDRVAPVISDERFVNYWNKLSKGEQADLKAKTEEPGVEISDEEWVQAFGFVPENKDKVASLIHKIHGTETADLKTRLVEQENKIKVSEAKQVLDDFIADGHEDFDQLEKFKFITYQLSQYGDTLAPSQYKRVIADAYNNAKRVYDEIYNIGKQEALGIIKTKQNNATLPPSNTDSNIYNGANPKKLSAAEAVALARQGKRVPDSW